MRQPLDTPDMAGLYRRLERRVWELERRAVKPPKMRTPAPAGGAEIYCVCDDYHPVGAYGSETVAPKTFTLAAAARVSIVASWIYEWSGVDADFEVDLLVDDGCVSAGRLRVPETTSLGGRVDGSAVATLDLDAGSHDVELAAVDQTGSGFAVLSANITVIAASAGDEDVCTGCCVGSC